MIGCCDGEKTSATTDGMIPEIQSSCAPPHEDPGSNAMNRTGSIPASAM